MKNIIVAFIYEYTGYRIYKRDRPVEGCCIYIIDGKKVFIALHLLVNW